MKALWSLPRILCLLLVLSGIALAQPARFEQVGQWVSRGQFKATLNGHLVAVYYTLTVSFPPRK